MAHVEDHAHGQGGAPDPARPTDGGDAARMLEAVHAFLRTPRPDLEATMVTALRDASYLAVVIYDPPLPPGNDGGATIPAGTTMRFRGRLAPDGKQLLAVYSDLAAVRKDLPGHPVQTTVLTAERMVTFALHPPHAGAVLNPAGPYLELRAPELRKIVPDLVPAG
ncbi:MAG: SseB family protein [Solirubrobacteraceae bacterium]